MPITKLSYFFLNKKAKTPFQLQIEKLIGFKINTIGYYQEAFTHYYDKNGNENNLNYERLEFLGDAVLGMIISEFLFNKKPNESEGYLTQMRSKFVNRNNLNNIGEKLNLAQFIISSKETNFGKNINGNILESLIGAIYKDKGIVYAKKFIIETILSLHDFEKVEKQISSYKNYLYEWTQKNKFKLELNTFEEDNAEDITIFVCVLRINGKVIAKGRDTNKKNAEENASKRAYYAVKSKI